MMTHHLPLYTILLGSASILSGMLAIHAWRHRQIAGALSLSILMALVAGWSLGYAFELGVTDLATKVFWGRLEYIPIAVIPLVWLLFAVEYAQHEVRSARKVLIGLSIAPVITILLQLTGDWHGLVWSSTRINSDGPFPILQVTYGPWFWVHTVSSYLLLLLGSLLMVQQIRRTNYLFRWRSVLLLSAVLLPWSGNAIYLAGVSELDLTPFAFMLTGLLLTWSIVGFRLLDLKPTAREVVLESMRDGVLVLDQQRRIVDLNPSAARIFGVTPVQVIGQAVERLHEGLHCCLHEGAAAPDSQGELSVGAGAERRIFEWRASPVHDRYGRAGGRIVLLRDVTEERRSAEERLQLIAMVEHSDDLIGMADLQGRMLYLNAGGLRMIGLSSLEAALERVMFEFLFPEDLSYFYETIVPEVQRLGHWRGDIRYRHFESGAPIPIYASIFLVRSLETDEPRAFATVSRDITARKRAETLLRQQAHYLTVLNAMGQAAIEISSTDLLLQTLSCQMGELLDADACWIERESLAVTSAVAVMATHEHRDGAEKVAVVERKAAVPAAPDGVVIIEDLQHGYVDTPDLSTEYCSAMVVPLLNGGERIGRAVVAFRQPRRFTPEEITMGEQAGRQIALALSRAKLYEEVTSQNRRLEAMISTSRDGVALVGVNQRILVLNQATLRLLDLPGTPADWTGRHLREMIETVGRANPEIATIIETELRRVLGGDRTPGTGEFTCGSHTVVWQTFQVRASAPASGRLVVLRDISEERALDQMRNDLIHTMVHDLRNPLTAIHAALSLLQLFPDTSREVKETTQIAMESSQKMLKMVSDILDLNRLESRKLPLHRIKIALPAIIANTVAQLTPAARARNQRLMYDVPEELPSVYIDLDITQRVLQNLIVNAIKFTPEHGLISIEVFQRDERPGELLVAIRDTGPGVPEALRKRLFGKFVKGDHPESGSGLGLAFCRLAVEAHGGTIEVSSTPGQGSTFTFSLPVAA